MLLNLLVQLPQRWPLLAELLDELFVAVVLSAQEDLHGQQVVDASKESEALLHQRQERRPCGFRHRLVVFAAGASCSLNAVHQELLQLQHHREHRPGVDLGQHRDRADAARRSIREMRTKVGILIVEVELAHQDASELRDQHVKRPAVLVDLYALRGREPRHLVVVGQARRTQSELRFKSPGGCILRRLRRKLDLIRFVPIQVDGLHVGHGHRSSLVLGTLHGHGGHARPVSTESFDVRDQGRHFRQNMRWPILDDLQQEHQGLEGHGVVISQRPQPKVREEHGQVELLLPDGNDDSANVLCLRRAGLQARGLDDPSLALLIPTEETQHAGLDLLRHVRDAAVLSPLLLGLRQMDV
mmetsp:Transcript_9774/g.36774  ORF Transcript_9774/g.36774 Transcript_9774/m.36774 type:complete len:356 (-) Transcript_9774:1315-2382(-)